MRHLAPCLDARSPFALRRCRWLGLIFFATLAVLPAAHLRAAPTPIAQDGDGWVTREVKGVGESLVKAKTDAVLTALRLIVGEFVRTEVKVTGETAEELIIAFSTADGIKSEQVGQPSFTPDGRVEVTMRVSVKPRQLVEMFEKEAQSAVFIDGETLAAEVAAARMNLDAQRALMRKLFTDLPLKLLVARIVDREGKPITSGRPDPKDVKPLGADAVGMALNIEIYFDLPSYYGKVVPNLMLALGAIASNQGQVDWAMDTWTQYDGGSSGRHWMWPSGYPTGTLQNSQPNVSPRLDPDDRVVAISIGRDRFGSQEQFQAYVIPQSVSEEIARSISSIDEAVMVCSLLDSSGNVIRQIKMELEQVPLIFKSAPSNRQRAGPPGFEVSDAYQSGSQSLHAGRMNGGPAPENNQGPWMTPRFTFSYDRWICDIVSTRIATSLPSSEFERLAGIAFDFETKDSANRQLEGRR